MKNNLKITVLFVIKNALKAKLNTILALKIFILNEKKPQLSGFFTTYCKKLYPLQLLQFPH